MAPPVCRTQFPQLNLALTRVLVQANLTKLEMHTAVRDATNKQLLATSSSACARPPPCSPNASLITSCESVPYSLMCVKTSLLHWKRTTASN